MNKIKSKFDHRLKTPEPHIVALIGEIDGIKGEFKGGLRMSPQAITSLKRSVLVTSAGSSTRIEGSKLTDAEVEKVLQGLMASKFSERDYQEVQGYLETLQNVFDSYQTLPLRESVIGSLHNELLKYSEPTPAWLAPAEMAELVDWTYEAFEQNRFHPLLVIANFIVEFLKIHPFEDGNGRLSRIMTNLLLLRSGYQFTQYVSHEQIVERRKDEYYVALKKSQDTFKTDKDTIAPWLNFFLAIIKEQATRALTYLKEENTEDMLSPKQYEVWKYISSVNEAGVGEIVEKTGIALGTVKQSLDRLLKVKKIKRIGRGRVTRYIIL